jgi:hypothetical protein
VAGRRPPSLRRTLLWPGMSSYAGGRVEPSSPNASLLRAARQRPAPTESLMRLAGMGRTHRDADDTRRADRRVNETAETPKTHVVWLIPSDGGRVGDSRSDSNDTAQRLAWAYRHRRPWQGRGFPPGSCPELTQKRSLVQIQYAH